jgi:hypothetical protein
MAEPRRLHSLGMHLTMRGLLGLFAGMGGLAAWTILEDGRVPATELAGLGVFALMPGVVGWAVLRTRPVWLNGEFLEVGRGARCRRVWCGDIESVEYTWWAPMRDQINMPLEITRGRVRRCCFFRSTARNI